MTVPVSPSYQRVLQQVVHCSFVVMPSQASVLPSKSQPPNLMLTGGRRKQDPYNSVASPIGKYPFLRRIMAVQGSPLALKEPPFGALELKRTVRAST